MKNHQFAVLDFFRRLKQGRVLDAGSGGNAIAGRLSEMGFDVFSLDLYETPEIRGGRFVRADLNNGLPFTDGAFDYVLCSESLQYLENHAVLFREFGRVLKRGGSVVLSMPNLLNAASRLYFLQRGYFPSFKPIRTVDGGKAWDGIAYNPVSLVEVVELAKRNGLTFGRFEASRMKSSNYLLYPVLKALYSCGLLFEKHAEKAELLRRLSSREALLGDHLIIQLERKAG